MLRSAAHVELKSNILPVICRKRFQSPCSGIPLSTWAIYDTKRETSLAWFIKSKSFYPFFSFSNSFTGNQDCILPRVHSEPAKGDTGFV